MNIAWSRIKGVSLVFLLVAFALSIAHGCKEDEKTEESASSESEAPSESTSSTPSAPSAPSEEIPPAEGKTERAKAPGRTVKTVATAPTLTLDVPEGVVAYAAISGFDDVVDVAGTIMDQMGSSAMPAAGLAEGVLQGIQSELGMKSMTWFDRKRPVSLAVWLDKAGDASGVVLVPVTGKDAVEAALPDGTKKNVEDNDFALSFSGEKVYCNVVSGYLVLSNDSDRMEKEKSRSFIEDTLAGYKPDGTLAIHFSAGMLTSMFKAELEDLKAEATRAMASSELIPGLAALSLAEVNYIFDLVDSVDWLTLGFKMKDVHALLSLEVSEKKGTEALAILAGHVSGRSPSIYKRLPASSYLVIGANTNPKAGANWAQMGMEVLAEMMEFSGEEKTKLLGHMTAMLNNGQGDSGAALYPSGNYPAAISTVASVRDGLAYRKDFLGAMDMFWNKAVTMYGGDIKDDLPPGFNLDSISAAFLSVAPLVEPFGLSLAITKDDSTDGVIVDTLSFKVDPKKLMPEEEMDVEMKIIFGMLGDEIGLSLAYGKDSMAFAMGPKAHADAKALVIGNKSVEHVGMQKVMTNALPGASLVLYASAIDGIKAFGAIPTVQVMLQQFGGQEPVNGLGISLGAVGQNALRLDVDVPMDHLMVVVAASQAAFFQSQHVPPSPNVPPEGKYR